MAHRELAPDRYRGIVAQVPFAMSPTSWTPPSRTSNEYEMGRPRAQAYYEYA